MGSRILSNNEWYVSKDYNGCLVLYSWHTKINYALIFVLLIEDTSFHAEDTPVLCLRACVHVHNFCTEKIGFDII